MYDSKNKELLKEWLNYYDVIQKMKDERMKHKKIQQDFLNYLTKKDGDICVACSRKNISDEIYNIQWYEEDIDFDAYFKERVDGISENSKKWSV